ncbi:MAG: peptidoglycan DD-metalloendopeptidase family protein [Oscillospiraceae bacterium]|nr:peptidoglycan DD-metalloendopeptidase family protein [Oscillospiraceae bacterium]
MYRQLILDKEYEARVAQEHAEDQLAIYKAHIRSMEEQGINNMYLQLLFSSSSMTELLSRMDMVSEIMEYDKRIHDNYVSAKETALTAKAEAEAAAAQLAVKEAELQTEIDRLTGELEGLQTELDRLMSDIDGYAAVINRYAADEARIDKEIKQMAEELKKQQMPPTSTGSFMWPLPASKGISSGYGMRKISLYGYEKFHAGIDVPAGIGNSILAADGGTVIVSTYDGGYGNYIMVNHGNGRVTLYAHMSSRAVDVGAEVKKGQVIGYVGSTGNSTGPHLHFEIRINGSAVDPCNYFTGYYFTKK